MTVVPLSMRSSTITSKVEVKFINSSVRLESGSTRVRVKLLLLIVLLTSTDVKVTPRSRNPGTANHFRKLTLVAVHVRMTLVFGHALMWLPSVKGENNVKPWTPAAHTQQEEWFAILYTTSV